MAGDLNESFGSCDLNIADGELRKLFLGGKLVCGKSTTMTGLDWPRSGDCPIKGSWFGERAQTWGHD